MALELFSTDPHVASTLIAAALSNVIEASGGVIEPNRAPKDLSYIGGFGGLVSCWVCWVCWAAGLTALLGCWIGGLLGCWGNFSYTTTLI